MTPNLRRHTATLAVFFGVIVPVCAIAVTPQLRKAQRSQRLAANAPGERHDVGELAAISRPNLVLLVIDTLRADHTGLGEYTRPTTPALDEAAKSGTYFSAAVAAAPSTVPSIKTLLAGRDASSWGLRLGAKPPTAGTWTLPQALRGADYATGAFSANPLIEGDGFEAGFEEFWSAGGYRFFLKSYLLNDLFAGNRVWDVFRLVADQRLHKIDGHRVSSLALRWIAEQEPAPFFVYLHLFDSHWPYYDHEFGFVGADLRALPEAYSHVDLQRLNHGAPANAAMRKTAQLQEMIARYDEEVRYADGVFAAFMSGLRALDLDDTTLVIVVGDHGEEFLEHNGFGHGHDLFEEQIHVPLLMLWPGAAVTRPAASTVQEPVSLVDLFPTLVDHLGLDDGGVALDGHSLLPLLDASAAGVHNKPPPIVSEAFLPTKIYGTYREGSRKARLRYDYGVSPQATPHVLIFELDADPDEQRPQAGRDYADTSFVDRARHALYQRWIRGRTLGASAENAGG